MGISCWCNVTVDNTFGEALPMYDSDFQVQWGDGEEDFAWSLDAYSDKMMPLEWELATDESATYDLVFEVPADLSSFAIVYLEQYTDEDGNSGEGDLFTVQFEFKKRRPGSGTPLFYLTRNFLFSASLQGGQATDENASIIPAISNGDRGMSFSSQY